MFSESTILQIIANEISHMDAPTAEKINAIVAPYGFVIIDTPTLKALDEAFVTTQGK